MKVINNQFVRIKSLNNLYLRYDPGTKTFGGEDGPALELDVYSIFELVGHLPTGNIFKIKIYQTDELISVRLDGPTPFVPVGKDDTGYAVEFTFHADGDAFKIESIYESHKYLQFDSQETPSLVLVENATADSGRFHLLPVEKDDNAGDAWTAKEQAASAIVGRAVERHLIAVEGSKRLWRADPKTHIIGLVTPEQQDEHCLFNIVAAPNRAIMNFSNYIRRRAATSHDFGKKFPLPGSLDLYWYYFIEAAASRRYVTVGENVVVTAHPHEGKMAPFRLLVGSGHALQAGDFALLAYRQKPRAWLHFLQEDPSDNTKLKVLADTNPTPFPKSATFSLNRPAARGADAPAGARPPASTSDPAAGMELGLFDLYDTAAARSEQLGYSSTSPQFLPTYSNGELTVAWRDIKAAKVRLSRYQKRGNGFAKVWTKDVPGSLPLLAGFAMDGDDFYCASAIEEKIEKDKTSGFRENIMRLAHMNKDGEKIAVFDVNELIEKAPSESVPKDKNAVYQPLEAGTGCVAAGGGRVALAFANMTVLDEAINHRHQRSSYLVFDPKNTSNVVFGETTGRHSFDQRLIFDKRPFKKFVFMDLGDAGWYMPAAGIAVHNFELDDPTKTTKLPAVKEGMYVYGRRGDDTPYSNYSFTSLGDICPTPLEGVIARGGYMIVLASERHNETSYAKGRQGFKQPIMEPRNLCVVHLSQDFYADMSGQDITDAGPRQQFGNLTRHFTRKSGYQVTHMNCKALLNTHVVNPQAKVGEHFTRIGKPQRTAQQGSQYWLTDHEKAAGVTSFASVERPKAAEVTDADTSKSFVILWEEWAVSGDGGRNVAYQTTKAVRTDGGGKKLSAVADLKGARLNPGGADRLVVLEPSQVAWIEGDARNKRMKLHILDMTGRDARHSTVDLQI